MNKITFENEYGIYTIESKQDFDHMGAVLNNLVRPVLTAAGYSESTLDKYVPYDEDFI